MFEEGNNFLLGSQFDSSIRGGQQQHKFSVFRSKVISAILATDMGQHMAFVDRFTARVNQIKESPFMEETKDDQLKKSASKTDRRLLLEAFLHTADLGHNFRSFDISKWGVLRLEQEWFLQGDDELDRGIPMSEVSPNCNRYKDCLA